MILTAHQPVYLPWLGLFHKIALADTFVVFDKVQYLRRDWNNRNKIKAVNGPIWLTVPVITRSKFDQILTEVEIDNTTGWKRKHLKSLELNYAKAPYFDRYIGFFRELYAREWKMLTDLNDAIFQYLLKELGITTKILYAHDLDLKGSKSDLVLDMCKKLGCDTYIFGALGRDYADVAAFTKAGVRVLFQDYRHPQYPQQFRDFEPYMSIVDLLFNCGEKSAAVLMGGNITKDDISTKELSL